MSTYEYKVVRFDLAVKYKTSGPVDGSKTAEEELNKLGEEGFKLIEVVEQYAAGLSAQRVFIFMREK